MLARALHGPAEEIVHLAAMRIVADPLGDDLAPFRIRVAAVGRASEHRTAHHAGDGTEKLQMDAI
jgi:hypothetical protein